MGVVGAAYLSQVHFSRAAGRALGRAGVVPQGSLHTTSALPMAGDLRQELAGTSQITS